MFIKICLCNYSEVKENGGTKKNGKNCLRQDVPYREERWWRWWIEYFFLWVGKKKEKKICLVYAWSQWNVLLQRWLIVWVIHFRVVFLFQTKTNKQTDATLTHAHRTQTTLTKQFMGSDGIGEANGGGGVWRGWFGGVWYSNVGAQRCTFWVGSILMKKLDTFSFTG